MATPIPTPLATILEAVKAQIVANTTVTDNRVLLVTKKRIPKFQGDQDCLILPGPIQALEDFSAAAGRIACIVLRPLVITIRTRFGVDMSDRSDSWITDPTLGHYVLEEALVAALHIYLPTDSLGNAYTQEPIHWVNSTSPEQDKQDQTWAETTLQFTIKYQIGMTQDITNPGG